MAIKDLAQVERELKKLDRRLGNLAEEDRRLRERIATATGISTPNYLSGAGTGGEIIAGDGLLGGGALPGTVTLSVYPGNGIDIVSDQVIVDESELDHALLGGVLANQHHDAITLHTDLNSNLLALSTQQLDLDTQAANLVFAGPTTGGAAKPTFRAMVVDDLVAHTHSHDTDLTDVSANDHHNQQHVLTGGDHTASGLTIGWVVRASGATTFVWAELQHGDLGGVGASDHHDPVTAGDGIDLSGQQVSVDVTDFIDTAYGLTENANDIRLNIGDGLEFDIGALEVDLHGTWSGLEFNAGDLRIDLDVAFTWAGTHTFQSDIQAECNLDFVGARSITTTADSLTLAPAADLLLNPGGDDVIFTWGAGKALSSSDYASQTTGWGISHGSSGGHADFRSMYADELHVEAFIADIYQALVGAIIVTKSRGRLSRDFTIPANSSSGTLYIEDLEGWENTQLFTANDVVRLRYVDTSGGGLIVTDVWGVVTAYTDLAGGEQSYTFTTSDDGGVSGNAIFTGAIALDYGQTASGSRGIWEATVLDAAGAPYSQTATWATNPWTPANWTTRVRLGNLDGISGIGLEYGLWAGQNTTDTFLLLSDSSFEVHGLDIKLYDGASNTVRLDPATPSIALGSTLPTGFGVGDGIWMGKDTVYKFRVGDVDGERLAWDGSDLYLYADNDNYIKATGSDLEFWSNATKTMWLDGDTGALFIDKMGDMLFSDADGLLLLGPPLRIEKESSTNYWHSTRKQKATITGALHLEAGRWQGTQALVVEEEATNLIENPSFEVNATDYWSLYVAAGGSRAQSTTRAFKGSASCKLAAGAGVVQLYANVIAALADGDSITIQGHFYRESSFAAVMWIYDVTNSATRATVSLSEVGQWERQVLTWTNDTGGAVTVRFIVRNNANDSASELFIDACQAEEKAYATSIAIGDMGDDYTWSGTAHNSTSTRAATTVGVSSAGIDTSSGSVVIWAKVPSDNCSLVMLWFGKAGYDTNGVYLSCYPGDGSGYFLLNGSTNRVAIPASSYPLDEWFLVAATWDGGNGKVYIDGQLIATGGTGTINTPDATMYFGSGPGVYENCTLGECAVFTADLSPAEVAQLHNLQRPLVDAGSTDKPGIYLIDGQFRLASSQTGTKTEINSAGIFGEDGDGAPTFTLLNEDMTVNGEALTAGDVLLGDNTASRANLLWDESAGELLLRVGTTVYTELNTSGVLTLGLTSAEHAIINTSGMTIRDGATTLANFGSTVTVGEVGASKGNVYITAGAVQLRTDTTVFAELTAVGVLLLGDDATGEYIQVASNGIRMYSQGSTRVRLDNAGTFWAGDSAVTERLQWDTTNGLRLFNASNEAVIKFGTSGDALITGKLLSAASPAARIEISDNYIAGYSDATTKEFYIDASDGKAYAGGGNVIFSDDGITLDSTTSGLQALEWKNGSDVDLVLYTNWDTGLPHDAYIQSLNDLYLLPVTGNVKVTLPTDGYFSVDKDARVGGGLYVGGIGTDPANDEIWLDSLIRFMAEISDPAAPSSNQAKLYIKDNGSGKTQLCVRFATGAIQVIATEP